MILKFLYEMYQVLQGHLLWLEVGMITLSGCSFNTDQRFLILKSIFSLNLCQVLQVCLLFLELDMLFIVIRL